MVQANLLPMESDLFNLMEAMRLPMPKNRKLKKGHQERSREALASEPTLNLMERRRDEEARTHRNPGRA